MTWQYVLSQISVVFAMIMLSITYFTKNKTKILLLSILFPLFYGIQYLLLGAYTGFAINIVNIVRSIWFFTLVSLGKKNTWRTFLFFILIFVLCGIITYSGPESILAIVAPILYTYAIWQPEIIVYRWMAVLCSICWIGYNLIVYSIVGTISEIILLILAVVGIIKFYKKKSKTHFIISKT